MEGKMPKSKNSKKKKMDKSSKIMFWVLAIIFISFIVIITISKNSHDKEVGIIDTAEQPIKGKETAPVQIVEFGDYKCPICKDVNESFIPVIQKELVDTGKANLHFMNYSFINVDSKRSAIFAETVYHELGNDTFWKFHELLYKKQPKDTKYEKVDLFTESFLRKTLREIVNDADTNLVVKAFKQGKYQKSWNTDMSYVKKLNVTGTPSFFINGKKFEGNTFEDFKKMVEEAEGNK
jgi:protein-disulfide isomerase